MCCGELAAHHNQARYQPQTKLAAARRYKVNTIDSVLQSLSDWLSTRYTIAQHTFESCSAVELLRLADRDEVQNM